MDELLFEAAFFALLFFVSLALSKILVPVSASLARLFGVIDQPDSRKVHKRAVPRMGGMAMAVAFFATLLFGFWGKLDSFILAFLLGGMVIFITGLVDDIKGISPRLKFVGEILAALVFVLVSGYQLDSLGNLLGFAELQLGLFALVFTVFAMVGVMNAMNLADGLDGLAAGLAFIASIFFVSLAYQHGAVYLVAIGVVTLGALLGFLRHNHYPAALFMGDSGSLLIGYTMAVLAVGLAQSDAGFSAVAPVNILLILALPIVDTLFVMSRRLVVGKNPFKPDKTHLHHRLQALGFGHAGVVVWMYVFMVFLGLLSWYAQGWPEWLLFYAALLFFTFFYLVIMAWLERQGRDLGKDVDGWRVFNRRIIRAKKKGFFQLLLKAIALLVPLLLLAPLFFIPDLSGLMRVLALFAALLLVILYPWGGGRSRMQLGHALLYLACFFLILFYLFSIDRPGWLLPLLALCTLLAFVWVLLKVGSSTKSVLLYPSGFEILMLFSSWALILLWLPVHDTSMLLWLNISLACIFSIPLLCFFKLLLGRDLSRNKASAAVFIFIFAWLGLPIFL